MAWRVTPNPHPPPKLILRFTRIRIKQCVQFIDFEGFRINRGALFRLQQHRRKLFGPLDAF